MKTTPNVFNLPLLVHDGAEFKGLWQTGGEWEGDFSLLREVATGLE